MEAIRKATKRKIPSFTKPILLRAVLGVICGCGVLTYSIVRIHWNEESFRQLERSDLADSAGAYLSQVEKQLLTSVSSTRALAAIAQLDAQKLMYPLEAEVFELVSATAALSAGSGAGGKNLSSLGERKQRARMALISNTTQFKFNVVARSLISTYKGISNLQFAPSGVVSVIHPLSGNEGAIGHDLFFDKNRRDGALKAIRSREITFVGPVTLIQNQKSAIIARFPVFLDSPSFVGDLEEYPSWFGFVTMLCEIDTFFRDAANAGDILGYSYVMYANRLSGEKTFVKASDEVPGQPVLVNKDEDKTWLRFAQGKAPVMREFKVKAWNVHWVMLAWPRDGWKETSPTFELQILLCVIFSLSGFVSLYSLLVRDSVVLEVDALFAKQKGCDLRNHCNDA
eukprot:TRINITY_DN6903_c0_g1_i1.p1 TRINITY_DN6903_c0_g1~~TRINITY_DN6903_c0_g1_i1.p1  ORF type:complete len:445 (+),score=48.76 TRINITY_DN6903_c0_g1_i1:142-1335(+)